MASILQQQLAVIAAKSTHQLDLKAQKSRHSQSLLYEPRDAATQSFDTIYQICIEAFDEICHLDTRFVPFGSSIFAESSKDVDRTQMTKRENEELDGVIEGFLGLVQGRLLLKPAIKCVEWLVRRFRVHEYNTEELLLTFLPYHDRDMFATVMSILPERLPVNFRWLQPYIASLHLPPRSAILAAISANDGFLTAFNSFVLRVAKAKHHSATLVGFWAIIIAQAVNAMIDVTHSVRDAVRKQREEDLLLRILPVLQGALSIKDIPELYLGTCMVITILVSKARLGERVLDALMQAVAGAWTEQTIEEGLACLAIIAEEKEQTELPRAVVSALTKRDDVARQIIGHGQQQRVGRFAAGLALGSLHFACKTGDISKLDIVYQVLDCNLLSEQLEVSVLEAVLKRCSEHTQEHEVFNSLSGLLRRLSDDEDTASFIEVAAKQLNVDLAGLDLAIVGTGSKDVEHVDAMDVDEADAQATEEAGQSKFDQQVDALPALPDDFTSFLDPAVSLELVQPFANLFHELVSLRISQDRFLSLPSLNKPRLATLLARIWTGPYPVGSRTAAITTLTKLLADDRERTGGVDSQALLPYALMALADVSTKVRIAAAGLCRVMHEAYGQDASSQIAATEFIETSRLYGSAATARCHLSTEEAAKFLAHTIIFILEDCILDAAFIARALSEVLNEGRLGTKNGTAIRTKELKKSTRTDLCTFLAAHAVATPALKVRLQMLSVLNHVGKSAAQTRKEILLPHARTWLTTSGQTVEARCKIQGVAVEDVDKAVLGAITHRSADELQLLQEIVEGQCSVHEGVLPAAFARLRQLFPLLKSAQADFVEILLGLALTNSTPEENQALALDTIRNLQLPTEVLIRMLDGLPNADNVRDQPPPAKKRRQSRGEADGSVDDGRLQVAIHRITLVMELVEASKPERHPQLLRGLFHILSELHHYKAMTGSELVYLYQMVLGSLLSVVDGINTTKPHQMDEIDRSAVRTDLIVECLRTTKSTQVHNVALLLVSSLAAWMPELVLHNVMPLFTFMSSTILRQTDDYSAHVADETVAKIVPPLAASLKKKGRDVVTGAAELLLSFVAAFEHIPLHRRLGLFQLLVKTLGEEDILFAVLAMLVGRYADDVGTPTFAVELANRFNAATIMKAVNQYLDLIADTQKPKRHLSDILLGFQEKSADAAIESTEALLDGLAVLLQDSTLRRKVASQLSDTEGANAQRIRQLYASLLEKAMQFTQTRIAKEVLKDTSDTLLRSVLGLLPTGEFIQSSAQLMQSGSDATRQQVFRSLESRASSARRGDKAAQQIFINVLPNCAVYIHSSQPIMTRYAAIACIDQITEKFGKTNRGVVLAAADMVAGEAALGSTERELRIISLLALASMVDVLADDAIGLLPRALNKALAYLESNVEAEEHDQQLLNAGFSLLNTVLGSLPWMLAAKDLERALKVSDHAVSADEDNDDDDNTIEVFCSLAARKVAPAELFAALERTWPDTVSDNPEAVLRHLQTLHTAIKFHTKSTATKNAQVLFNVLLRAFDLRRGSHNTEDEEGAEAICSLVDAIAMDLTLKLNDATFRPFFMRLVDWATAGLPKTDVDGRTLRSTSLYSFALTLSEQLKSLVTSYASFLLESAAHILQQAVATNPAERKLRNIVLQTLCSSFRHDQDDFWQAPAHFDAIAAPLLIQVKNARLFQVTDHIVPTIADFASAASSPEHLKSINGALMSYMRDADAAVRLGAVKCERAITERLSLEWLTLLPEMLPVISELLEDDSEEVEREVLRWVKEIEEATGESLDGMLA